MKCPVCNRELKDDSQFCDMCGNKVLKENQQDVKMKFNSQALIMGILISIFLTLLLTGTARIFGLPILFGGLFLPFFWKIKNEQK